MTANNVSFPCRQVPDDPHAARLLGLYSQRQEGQWMQRLKVLGGHLTSQQWRGLADIVRQFTPDCPLHLTTRQGIELHTLTDDRIPGVQHRIAEMGLTCLGACGEGPVVQINNDYHTQLAMDDVHRLLDSLE